uniref:Translation initiation factor 5A-like N-terminal domain-containing protein n=1 Tax=Ananas comosus var. bracteatus TaxID=296719 RepID=A0A6V7Q9V3_ANACO|nr:unnamed protein product [Ananas comosus var. bracteatus]
MSDEEHHFESKAYAGVSKSYRQQAGTICKNGYIVIKGRPCKVWLIVISIRSLSATPPQPSKSTASIVSSFFSSFSSSSFVLDLNSPNPPISDPIPHTFES